MRQPRLFLQEQIDKALRRWRRGLLTRGLALLFSVFATGFGLIFLLRSQWLEHPWFVPVFSGITLIVALYVFLQLIYRPLRKKITPAMVARSIEERHPELEDRLVTAIDHSQQKQNVSDRWLQRLLKDTIEHIHEINLPKQIQISGYRVWQTALALATFALLSGFFLKNHWQPDLQKLFKSGFKAPKPRPEFQIIPGDAKIKRGDPLQIKAILTNFTVDEGKLFLSFQDSSWKTEKMELIAESGDFQYQLYDLQDSLRYYVRIGDKLSKIYRISVYDSPEIKRIDLTYIYPEFARLPRRYERDGGDIWAPVGTRVRLRVTTTWPTVQADLLVGEKSRRKMQLVNDTTAIGELKVARDGLYRIQLKSREGLDNSPLVEYYIHAVKNQPPILTLNKPGKDIKATMLEEIPIVAEVTDDFGLEKVQLAVTINTRPEQILPLQRINGPDSDENELTYQTRKYERTLYLEDLKLKPGDFLSYYVQAKDRQMAMPVTSDLYFIEIRNFEDIYVLSTSQQSGARGGMSNSLSRLQKEIILATHKLLRNRKNYQKKAYQQNVKNLQKSQESLKSNIEQIARSMKMRLNFVPREGRAIVRQLDLAIAAMKRAIPLIGQDSLKSALQPEREAYHYLLRADTMIRKRELTAGKGSGGSSAPQANQDELARLFHDEMDKLKNKYETLQQGDRPQMQTQLDEALRQIRELAKRQQRLNDMNRQLAQNNLSPEEKKHEIKKLQRQQEQLNRDMRKAMDQMSNSLQNRQLLNKESLRNMQRASNAMNQTMSRLRRQDPQSAAASGQQALNQLRKIEDRLRKNQQNALRQNLENLENQFQQLAQAQKSLSEKTQQLRKSPLPNQKEIRNQLQKQERLKQQTQAAMNRLQKLIRSSRDNPDRKKELQQTYRDLLGKGARMKMQQSQQALQSGRLKQAENLQKKASEALLFSAEKLAERISKLKNSSADQLELALQQTEALRKRLEAQLEQQRKYLKQGKRTGAPDNQTSGKERLTEDLLKKWREILWQGQKQLQNMQRNFPNTDTSLSRTSERLINQIHGIVRTFRGGDANRLEQVQNQIVDPLRRFEAELAMRLQLLQRKETLRTVLDEQVPPKYKEFIEAYYRSLAKEK